MKLEYIIKNNKYENVKQVLKEEFYISNRLLSKLKQYNQIYLNNIPTYINQSLKINDCIAVNINFDENSENIIPVNMNLNILYEDEYLLIIDKPPFLPVHPSINHYEDSLSNGIKYYFNSIGLKRKIRPINRLDKNTSGIVLFAKNEYIQECLIKQMNCNNILKEYIAIVEGNVSNINFTINAPIGRKENSIIERCVHKDGDVAITDVKLIKNYNNYALIKCILKTGRTHQIRVHLSSINHTILGDTLYGSTSNIINRQALHSHKIEFIHPINKNKIEIISKLPEDMKKIAY